MNRLFYHLESWLKHHIPRRKFLKIMLGGFATFLAQNQFLKIAFAAKKDAPARAKRTVKGQHDLVVAQGNNPFENTVKAVDAMGGMARFVKKGQTVVVKPNMAWDRNPAQAANTEPQVVAALVEMCYKAGARRVNVFDVPCNDDRRVYEHSGIKQAAEDKGAYVYYADHWNVVKAKFSYESPMNGWPILRDAVACDVFINAPVLKHHGLTKLTLSMKNLMGVCSGTRGLMHVGIGRKLADLTDFINPDLTVIDATRVLTKHGPSGGNLDDVMAVNKVIVGTDPVLTDSYACRVMERDPLEITYIKTAKEYGYGSTDLDAADIFSVKA